ncbi:MAG TPA: hypothetical protein VJB98_00915 [Candidatus Paceibacterota bacterium]
MKILELREGCTEKIVEHIPCFGPPDSYYTLFGHELFAQTFWVAVSVVVGLVLILALGIWRHRQPSKMPVAFVFVVPVLIALVLFVALVYFWPVLIYY